MTVALTTETWLSLTSCYVDKIYAYFIWLPLAWTYHEVFLMTFQLTLKAQLRACFKVSVRRHFEAQRYPIVSVHKSSILFLLKLILVAVIPIITWSQINPAQRLFYSVSDEIFFKPNNILLQECMRVSYYFCSNWASGRWALFNFKHCLILDKSNSETVLKYQWGACMRVPYYFYSNGA